MKPRSLLPVVAFLVALGGCAGPRNAAAPQDSPPAADAPAAQACAAEAPPPAAATPPPPSAESAPAPAPACHPDVAQGLLQQADRIRALSATALTAEIARLASTDDPDGEHSLRLALALAQTRQPADTARALGLVQRALAQASAAPLHPLARLLEDRLLQQRRLEEQLDRQNHQLRDAQRRNELLGERLEAMRALERSLNTRPATRPAPLTLDRGPEGAR